MIILDTEVLSAVMRTQSDPAVRGWLNKRPRNEIWTSGVSIMEVVSGIERLPAGRRRSQLLVALRQVIVQVLDGRIAALDLDAAFAAGELDARRRRAGLNIGVRDTQIAGIALARGASVATRNGRHFADAGVPIINPWDAEGVTRDVVP